MSGFERINNIDSLSNNAMSSIEKHRRRKFEHIIKTT